jgi:hypothetical protein
MATLNREAIEQEIGKRFEKIEKTLERTLEKTLKAALESPAAARAQAAAERAQYKISTARKSLDDVLLGLEHKGYNVKEPQDLIQTVGRRVLSRASAIAEDVRSQVAAKSYSPTWVRDIKIPRPAEAAPMKKSKGATEGDGALATEVTTAAQANVDIASTSVAEASQSDEAADFGPAGKAPAKKSKLAKFSKSKK